MRNPLLGLCFVVVFAGTTRSQPATPATKIAQLIEQLGSPDFALREAASHELATIGEPALPALKQAAKSMDDLEVTQRASELLVTIQKQIETDRLLAPTLVTLNCENKSLEDILQQLEKQAHYKFQCDDNALLSRRITIKTTGRVPLWQVLDDVWTQLQKDTTDANQQQDLAKQIRELEAKIVAAMNMNTKIEQIRELQAELVRLVTLSSAQVTSAFTVTRGSGASPLITVNNRRRTAPPISVSKAVYVESLPYPAPAIKDQLLTLVQVTAEPKVQLLRIESVRVMKAIDDKQQALETIPVFPSYVATPDPNRGAFGGRQRVFDTDPPTGTPNVPFSMLATQAVVRFNCGDKPTRLMKDVQGVVRATVRTPAEDFATVTELDKAPNCKINTTPGITVKVSKMSVPTPPNFFLLELISEFALGDQQFGDVVSPFDPNDVALLQNGAFRGFGGRGRVRPDDIFHAKYSCLNGLKVLDEKGQVFDVETSSSARRFTNNGRVEETLKLIIAPTSRTTGLPTSLTLSGTRTRIVEIPFKLANVPVVAAPHD